MAMIRSYTHAEERAMSDRTSETLPLPGLLLVMGKG